MRGTLLTWHCGPFWWRFIPAYAGNISGVGCCDACKPVHPRVCGEHFRALFQFLKFVGSSPRMRGTWIPMPRQYKGDRFIPAYAGNILESNGSIRPKTVHPRVCGEHPKKANHRQEAAGSSPRMRGTWSRFPDADLFLRFIPAYAGNIYFGAAELPHNSVHPRVCGEHKQKETRRGVAVGSSPRMRGTCTFMAGAMADQRFIPAYAGNMGTSRMLRSPEVVHPRVCGEHISSLIGIKLICGSSPRMRGTCNHNRRTYRGGRFIPAYAGNMKGSLNPGSDWSVHPRVCGEHRC